jgi:hypothetical protein
MLPWCASCPDTWYRGTRPDVTPLGGVPLLVNCAARKIVAVTWKEKAEAVTAAALSTLAMAARGRLSG